MSREDDFDRFFEALDFPDRLDEARVELEVAARAYAAFSHGNLSGAKYRDREEARDALLDALSHLDHLRQKAA